MSDFLKKPVKIDSILRDLSPANKYPLRVGLLLKYEIDQDNYFSLLQAPHTLFIRCNAGLWQVSQALASP